MNSKSPSTKMAHNWESRDAPKGYLLNKHKHNPHLQLRVPPPKGRVPLWLLLHNPHFNQQTVPKSLQSDSEVPRSTYPQYLLWILAQ